MNQDWVRSYSLVYKSKVGWTVKLYSSYSFNKVGCYCPLFNKVLGGKWSDESVTNNFLCPVNSTLTRLLKLPSFQHLLKKARAYEVGIRGILPVYLQIIQINFNNYMIISGQNLCIILLIILFLVNEKRLYFRSCSQRDLHQCLNIQSSRRKGGTVATYLNLGF